MDFLIAPVNESRINAVNDGPFVLGMNRCPRHQIEYDALSTAPPVLLHRPA